MSGNIGYKARHRCFLASHAMLVSKSEAQSARPIWEHRYLAHRNKTLDLSMTGMPMPDISRPLTSVPLRRQV
jgi:hypothetical protein